MEELQKAAFISIPCYYRIGSRRLHVFNWIIECFNEIKLTIPAAIFSIIMRYEPCVPIYQCTRRITFLIKKKKLIHFYGAYWISLDPLVMTSLSPFFRFRPRTKNFQEKTAFLLQFLLKQKTSVRRSLIENEMASLITDNKLSGWILQSNSFN